MTSRSLAALLSALLSATLFASPAHSAPARPDLVIRSFGLREWGTCAPGQPVFTFQVTIANVGSAAAPAMPGRVLVEVTDQHGNGWGNKAGIVDAIPPGGSRTVQVPVYYPRDNPDHMTAAAPHPFQAVADPAGLVAELDESNNRSATIQVGAPRGCPGQPRTTDGPSAAGGSGPAPVITGYTYSGACVPRGGAFKILGRNFGSPAGRHAGLGGHAIHVDLPVTAWTDTVIATTLPDDPRIEEGQWYYTGIHATGGSGAWLSNIDRTLSVCRSRATDWEIRGGGGF